MSRLINVIQRMMHGIYLMMLMSNLILWLNRNRNRYRYRFKIRMRAV